MIIGVFLTVVYVYYEVVCYRAYMSLKAVAFPVVSVHSRVRFPRSTLELSQPNFKFEQ